MGMSEFAAMLRSAQADLRAIEHMPDAYAFDEQVFGFHAQQACEKALKAWLMHLGCKPPACTRPAHIAAVAGGSRRSAG
jgi:HEPN domain-containing protein